MFTMSEKDMTLRMRSSDLIPATARLASRFQKLYASLFRPQKNWSEALRVYNQAPSIFASYKAKVLPKIQEQLKAEALYVNKKPLIDIDLEDED